MNIPEFENFSIDEENNTVVVSVNPKLFPLEAIYPAAYMFLEDFYVMVDGNPETEIYVKLSGKRKLDREALEKAAREFNNEMVNYSVYVIQSLRNAGLRSAILNKALEVSESAEDVVVDDMKIEDPEGISEPWTPEKMKGLVIPDEIKEILEKAEKIESDGDESNGKN